MGTEAVIIGEILVAMIQAWAIKAKAAGLTDEQISGLLDKALEQIISSKPEALPEP